MAITSTVNKHIFNLNGTQTVFPFSFKIFTPSTDLTVIHRTAAGVETVLTYASDYTVAAVDEDYTNGGNVTLADPYSNGDQLVIAREMELTQETDYTENDPFPAETHENALDKLTMIAQQLDEKIGRNLTVPITDSEPGNLPNATDRAGNFLAFDVNGDPIAAAAVTGVPVTPFMQTLLDDVDAAAGRTTLDVYGKSEVYTQTEVDAFFEETVTAAENIDAGDAVGVLDGKYYKCMIRELQKLDPGKTFAGTNDADVLPTNKNRILVAIEGTTNIEINVADWDPVTGSASFLSGAWLDTASGAHNILKIVWLTPFSSGDFAVAWQTPSGVFLRVGNLTGTTLTWLTATATVSGGGDYLAGLIRWEGAGVDGSFVVFYGTASTAFVRPGYVSGGAVTWWTAAVGFGAGLGVSSLLHVANSMQWLGGDWAAVLLKDSTDLQIYHGWFDWTGDGSVPVASTAGAWSLQHDTGDTAQRFYTHLHKIAPYRLYATWVTAAGATQFGVQYVQYLDYSGIVESGGTRLFNSFYGPAKGPVFDIMQSAVNNRPVQTIGILGDGREVFPPAAIHYCIHFRDPVTQKKQTWTGASYAQWEREAPSYVMGNDRDIIFFVGAESNDANKFVILGYPLFFGIALETVTAGNPLRVATRGATVAATGMDNGIHHVNLLTGAVEDGFITGADFLPIGMVFDEKLYIDQR